jgi:4-hydroxybenzoate polyprenyltransferase
MSDFSGQKNLIGILILLGVPSVIAMLLAVLVPLPFTRGGKLIIALLILTAVLLAYLHKLKRGKKTTPQ